MGATHRPQLEYRETTHALINTSATAQVVHLLADGLWFHQARLLPRQLQRRQQAIRQRQRPHRLQLQPLRLHLQLLTHLHRLQQLLTRLHRRQQLQLRLVQRQRSRQQLQLARRPLLAQQQR